MPTIAPTAPEDDSQLKSPPELGMQVPVEPSKNPSVVIPPLPQRLNMKVKIQPLLLNHN